MHDNTRRLVGRDSLVPPPPAGAKQISQIPTFSGNFSVSSKEGVGGRDKIRGREWKGKLFEKKSISDLNTSTVSSTHLLCVSFYLYIDLSLKKVILSKWIALHFEGSSSRRATKEASKSIRDINSPTPLRQCVVSPVVSIEFCLVLRFN